MSPDPIKKSLWWTFFWVAAAFVFSIFIYFLYNSGFAPPKTGWQASLEFLAGYLLEKSLSLDNLFVFTLIFTFYKIPTEAQHRVLKWGIISALFLRAFLIISGLALIHAFTWLFYIFGLFLIGSGIHLLYSPPKENLSKENALLNKLKQIFPITLNMNGQKFFLKEEGQWKATPLFFALIQIELTDIVFALDSIPAIFAITLDPLIIWTSNIFALIGLRSFYFVLAHSIPRLKYLTTSIAIILIFVGLKLFLIEIFPIPTLFSLTIILVIISAGILLSKRKEY